MNKSSLAFFLLALATLSMAIYAMGSDAGYKNAKKWAQEEIEFAKKHNEHIGWMKGHDAGYSICKNSYTEGLDAGESIGLIKGRVELLECYIRFDEQMKKCRQDIGSNYSKGYDKGTADGNIKCEATMNGIISQVNQ